MYGKIVCLGLYPGLISIGAVVLPSVVGGLLLFLVLSGVLGVGFTGLMVPTGGRIGPGGLGGLGLGNCESPGIII